MLSAIYGSVHYGGHISTGLEGYAYRVIQLRAGPMAGC